MRAFLIAIVLVGATTIAFADDVDWKLYGGASVENTPEFCFFDAKSVRRESGGQFRVWTKCLAQKELESVELGKTSIEKGAQKVAYGCAAHRGNWRDERRDRKPW